MKSIKEKAEDVFPDHCDDSMHELNIKMRIGFGAGANYVLNLLSETIHVSKDAYLKDNLFEMIKQLKK